MCSSDLGRTVVKLQGPDDPMVVLDAEPEADGDTVTAENVTFTATVTGAEGASVRFVLDGEPEAEIAVDADPFVATLELTPKDAGRVRAEVVVDDHPRVVTSHIWLEAPVVSEGGCGCGGDGSGALLLFGMWATGRRPGFRRRDPRGAASG